MSDVLPSQYPDFIEQKDLSITVPTSVATTDTFPIGQEFVWFVAKKDTYIDHLELGYSNAGNSVLLLKMASSLQTLTTGTLLATLDISNGSGVILANSLVEAAGSNGLSSIRIPAGYLVGLVVSDLAITEGTSIAISGLFRTRAQ